jgi:AcrR family transcriptional regulator
LPPRPEAVRQGPGRPSSGARERILEAALDVLEREGYAGLTTAKVAARSGENKALISYHYGSKQGLLAEAARQMRTEITDEVLAGIQGVENAEDLARGLVDALWGIADRDPGLARVYFDLEAQPGSDPEVRQILDDMKDGYLEVIREVLGGLPGERDVEAAAIWLMAMLEGLTLERLDHGDTPVMERARELFVRSASAALSDER